MRIFVLIVWSVLLSFQGNTQELPLKKDPIFKEGEVLKYKLKYGFITAAEATIKVLPSDLMFENKPTYRLNVDA